MTKQDAGSQRVEHCRRYFNHPGRIGLRCRSHLGLAGLAQVFRLERASHLDRGWAHFAGFDRSLAHHLGGDGDGESAPGI